MHQYKTLIQIILTLSIFNLVLAAPVVQEIYDARDDKAVVGNVAVMSKGRRQPSSEGPTPSHPSLPPPDGLTRSHSSPALLDGSTPLQPPPALTDASGSVPSSSGSEGGLAPLPNWSPPPLRMTTQPVTGDPSYAEMQAELQQAIRQQKIAYLIKIGRGLGLISFAGGLALFYRYHHHHHRETDSDWYVSNLSHLSCIRLKVPNHTHPDLL